jgi:hypothetical protein
MYVAGHADSFRLHSHASAMSDAGLWLARAAQVLVSPTTASALTIVMPRGQNNPGSSDSPSGSA